jgi:hypothetical protein
MSALLSDMLPQLLATDAPALPSAVATYIGLRLAWGAVLASLAVVAIARWWPGVQSRARLQWGGALLLALSAWLPGAYSTAYWLGLVFQMPSAMAFFLSATFLCQQWRVQPPPQSVGAVADVGADRTKLLLALVGVLAGWALLLDSFALLPLQLYAWGFSPIASGLILLVALLPWIFYGRAGAAHAAPMFHCLAPGSVLVFIVWRLPSGNAWDAMLDPLLWLALHGYLLRTALAYKSAVSRGR